MANLNKLKELTSELALEIESNKHGSFWNLITYVLDSIASPTAIISRNHTLLYINKETQKRFDECSFTKDYLNKSLLDSEFCKALNDGCDECIIQKTIDTKEVYTIDFYSTITDIRYKMICIPLIFNGVSGVLVILSDKNDK